MTMTARASEGGARPPKGAGSHRESGPEVRCNQPAKTQAAEPRKAAGGRNTGRVTSAGMGGGRLGKELRRKQREIKSQEKNS